MNESMMEKMIGLSFILVGLSLLMFSLSFQKMISFDTASLFFLLTFVVCVITGILVILDSRSG